jgi:hypothetical protein
MMIDYAFYIKKSPLGDRDFKIGITAIRHIASRLGSYQNAFGPTYQERFETIWIGPEEHIRELERLLKINYRNKIAGTSRGFTEWITDINYEDLVIDIQKTIDALGVEADKPKNYAQIFEDDARRLQSEFLIEQVDSEAI